MLNVKGDFGQSTVPHLLCKGNMVVPYLDFRKSSEPARSLCLAELTRNQWITFSKLTGEDPGKEIAFPYAGDFEVVYWSYQS